MYFCLKSYTGIPEGHPGRCLRWDRGWWDRQSTSGGSPLALGSHSARSSRPTATPERRYRSSEPQGPGWMKPRCCSLHTDCSLCTDSHPRPPGWWTRPTWPPAGQDGEVRMKTNKIYIFLFDFCNLICSQWDRNLTKCRNKYLNYHSGLQKHSFPLTFPKFIHITNTVAILLGF